jgi:hypothetical protein
MARRTQDQRYRRKVTRRGKNQCWHWRSALTPKGYGTFYVRDESRPTGMRAMPAHRYAYQLAYGDIPEGKVVSHSCNSRDCQNPRHLRVMQKHEPSLQENRKLTHCPKGHKYTPENTIYHSKSGARMCRLCTRTAQLRYIRRVRTENPEYQPTHPYNRRKPLKYAYAGL